MNLFIDTAYSLITFAVIDNEKTIDTYQINSKNNHTIEVYKVYNQFLGKYDINNIETIYIINGPGSYTGTRIGVVFAKTIAMIHNLKIAPVDLLEITYLTTGQKPALDARGNKYFCYNGVEKQLICKEDAEKEYEIDLKIDYNKLGKYLKNFSVIDYKEIKINYLKPAI